MRKSWTRPFDVSCAQNPVAPTPPAEAGRATEEAALSYLRDEESPRSLRLALIAAAVAHALLLLVPLPRTEATVPEPEKKEYRVVPTPRFKPPELPLEEPPRPPTGLVPIPDPDPTDPEPLRPFEAVDRPYELAPLDVVADIPEAPPEADPEPTGPYVIDGRVEAPVRLETPMPRYTEIARRVREECVVLLETVIDHAGRVTDIEVVQPCRFGLTEAAVEAVERWRYRPAMLGERAVPVYMTLRIDFTLD